MIILKHLLLTLCLVLEQSGHQQAHYTSMETNNFIGNSANQSSGGAICAVTNTKLSFIGTSDFGYNSADRYGGAIEAFDNVKITFNGTNNFVNNFVQQFGGAIHAQSITVHFHWN